MSFRRIAGIAGIVFFVLIVVNIVSSGQPPMLDDPVAEIDEFYADDDSLQVAAVANQLAGVFIAVFGAGLLSAIWLAERGLRQAWAVVGLIGLVVTYAAIDASAAAHTTLLINAGGLDDGVTRALYDMSSVSFVTGNYNTAIFLLGAGAGIVTTRILPRWLGGAALVGAAVGWLSAFGHGDRDALTDVAGGLSFIASALFLLFVLIAGVMLATRAEADVDAPAVA